MANKSKQKGGKRWIQELETRDSVKENEGTFSEENSPEEIAIELKRRAPSFQSAVGKITLYLNRAGKRLSKSRRKELERIPTILRELYNRKDRQRANNDRPVKIDIKTSSIKYAALWGKWVDDNGNEHIGDQFTELLLADQDGVKKVHSEISWEDLEDYRSWIIDYYFKKDLDSMSEEDKKAILTRARSRMINDFRKGEKIPFWDLTKNPNEKDFEIVSKSKVASREIITECGNREMIFASAEDAMQYLADLMDKQIIIDKA